MNPKLTDCPTHGQQVLVAHIGGSGKVSKTCVKCWRNVLAANRRCACSCGASLWAHARNVKYVNERHKQRAHREDLKARAKALGVEASLSVKTLDRATGTDNRRGDGDSGAAKPQRARSKPRKPSLRISYRKAVAQVADGLLRRGVVDPPTDAAAFAIAHSFLRPVLTDRQRAAL